MCKHGRLRTVGFDWFCCDCGEQLDPKALFGKKNDGQKAPADEKTDKPTPKKRTAKTAK